MSVQDHGEQKDHPHRSHRRWKPSKSVAPSRKSVRSFSSKRIKTYHSAGRVKTADAASLLTYKSTETKLKATATSKKQIQILTKQPESKAEAELSKSRRRVDIPIHQKIAAQKQIAKDIQAKRIASPQEVASSRASIPDTNCPDNPAKDRTPTSPKVPKEPRRICAGYGDCVPWNL
jgi:hypothetical protein